MEKNPEVIQKFTNAIYKAQQWVYSHTAEEIAMSCISHFPESTLTDLTKVMKRYKDIEAWAPKPLLEKSNYERFMDIMEEANELETRAPYEKIITVKFANEAING